MADVTVDISVLGDKVLSRRFNALASKMQAKILKKTFRVIAKDIKASANSRIPIGPSKEKGRHLKGALKVRVPKKKKGLVSIEVQTPQREVIGVSPDDEFYYPSALELGSKKQREESFLRVGLDENRGAGLNKIKNAIRDGIKNASKT